MVKPPPDYVAVFNGWSPVVHAARSDKRAPVCKTQLRHWKARWFEIDEPITCLKCLKLLAQEEGNVVE